MWIALNINYGTNRFSGKAELSSCRILHQNDMFKTPCHSELPEKARNLTYFLSQETLNIIKSMTLKIYNTLTKQKEIFIPFKKGRVGIYVCGPTVYDHPHIGHAKSYISFDVIVRYLRHLGYKVRYVQNITDVGHLTDNADAGEDKIEKRAKLEQVEPMELVEMYMRSYYEDMDALNNLRPDISPRATGHIPEQIELVEKLIDKGFAYEANQSVYFDVSKLKDYGKLSGRKLDEQESGARIEINPEKKHPADFALWKKAGAGHIMKWNSPWGVGFPGWHLECSVMSMKYLGETFDIHGGGIENVFPHHECEIAQSETANELPFARYWMHNNMVTVEGQKMGKSLGNFVTLKDAFKLFSPLTIRFFVLNTHYSSPIDYSNEALDAADKGLERLHNTIRNLRERLGHQGMRGLWQMESGRGSWKNTKTPLKKPWMRISIRQKRWPFSSI